jgi:hypothetical protein
MLEDNSSFRYSFLSGLILGLGFGLKLTAGIYVVGGMLAMMFIPLSMHKKIKLLFLCGIGIFIGTLITSGYWMLMMWNEHHNPLFPFFNHFFHSPDFSQTDWRDTRFLPKNIWQTLFYPFYFSMDGRIADAPFRDFRFAVLYVLFVVAGIQFSRRLVVPRLNSEVRRPAACPRDPYLLAGSRGQAAGRRTSELSRGTTNLLLFFIFSYFIWQYYFSIARYLAPLEMLAPLMIYLLIRTLFKTPLPSASVTSIIFLGLFITLSPIPMIRAPWYETSFFNVKLPTFVTHTPAATVLIAYPAFVRNTDPRPQAYLIPFFPTDWRFIGMPLLNEKTLLDAKTIHTIRNKLAHSSQPFYLLTSDRNMPELYRAAQLFVLSPAGLCEKIFSDRQAVTHQQVLLCPVLQSKR